MCFNLDDILVDACKKFVHILDLGVFKVNIREEGLIVDICGMSGRIVSLMLCTLF